MTNEERAGKAGCSRIFLGFLFLLVGAAVAVFHLAAGIVLMALCAVMMLAGMWRMRRVERAMRLAAFEDVCFEDLEAFGDVVKLAPEQFERYAAALFRAMGFRVLRPKVPSEAHFVLVKDGRVKLAQWIHPPHQIPSEDIRAFYEEMLRRGAAGGFVVTAGVFTELARRFAEDLPRLHRGKPIELVDGAALRSYFEEVYPGKKPSPPPAARKAEPFRKEELEELEEAE